MRSLTRCGPERTIRRVPASPARVRVRRRVRLPVARASAAGAARSAGAAVARAAAGRAVVGAAGWRDALTGRARVGPDADGRDAHGHLQVLAQVRDRLLRELLELRVLRVLRDELVLQHVL